MNKQNLVEDAAKSSLHGHRAGRHVGELRHVECSLVTFQSARR